MKTKTISNLGAVFLLLALSGAASAAEVCTSRDNAMEHVNAVSDAISGSSFLGKRAYNDQTNMLIKAEAAISKLKAYKFDDANDKLVDISDKANALADSPKVKLADATAINNAVGDAVVCINDIM